MRNKHGDGVLFFKYVIPSMISMLTAGIYTLVDGFFVGWGAGSKGLAAINVAFPLALLIVAVGEMIGTGSAIVLGLARGRGHLRTAERVFGNLLALILTAAVLLPLLLGPVIRPLLQCIGAEASILPEAVQYTRIIVGGAFFQLVTIGLVAVMRNDHAPARAMRILVIGLVANILFDYLFVLVFRGGVAGSAWATLLAQAICAGLAWRHFAGGASQLRIRGRLIRIRRIWTARLLAAGVPSLGVQLSIALVILLHNRQALAYGGVAAVAAYAIISYVEATILLLIQGIGSGIQPVVSYLHGAGLVERRRRMARHGIVFAVSLGFLGMLLSIGGRHLIPELFNARGEVLALAAAGLLISAPVYLMLGFLKVSESYFQSMERPAAASLLIYLDCCAVLPLCLLVLPHFWGLDGVWAAMPVSKLLMILPAVWLWRRARRQAYNPTAPGKDGTL